jgi:hypothetical protein
MQKHNERRYIVYTQRQPTCWCTLRKFVYNILNLRTMGPTVDSVSNTNEYQKYFLGGKGGRCVGLKTLPPSCAYCLEILGASTSWSPKGLSRPL